MVLSSVAVSRIRAASVTAGVAQTAVSPPQVFPYLYVPYDDDLPADPAAAHTYLRDLAQGIEIAMRAGSQARLMRRVIDSITRVLKHLTGGASHEDLPGRFLTVSCKCITTVRMARCDDLADVATIEGRRLMPQQLRSARRAAVLEATYGRHMRRGASGSACSGRSWCERAGSTATPMGRACSSRSRCTTPGTCPRSPTCCGCELLRCHVQACI